MKSIDWKAFATIKFKPHLVPRYSHYRGTCGTYALHCLTGVPLTEIEKLCPRKGWWGDFSMRSFLRRRGYTTIPIKNNLVHASKPYQYRENINHQHILLISAHSSESEGTWEVVHNHRIYHGHEIDFFTGYELLINPLWTAYLVWHPKWKSSEAALKKDCDFNWISHNSKDSQFFHPLSGKWFKT